MSAITLLQLPKSYFSPLAKTFDIKARKPYIVASDMTLAAAAAPTVFPDGSFIHSLDLPFEVLRMIPAVACLDGSLNPIPDPNIGDILHLVKVKIKLLSDSRDMTLVSTRLSELVEKENKIWSFDYPLYLERQNGFVVEVTNLVPLANAANVRFELGLQGSLLIT
jgi:hypothetical protein